MKRVLILMALTACTSSPNYARPYTPIQATHKHSRPSAVQKAVIALTDAGREIESSDAATGIVLSKWFEGDGALAGNYRYRIRVVLDETSGYAIEALCQAKNPEAFSGGGWIDCPKIDGQDLRPQFVLDLITRVNAALM